jgi:hypothetical protein
MKGIVFCLLIATGCASAPPRPEASAPARSEAVVATDECEDLGRIVYNARNPVLNPTETMGPSEVVRFHGKRSGILTRSNGHLFLCSADGSPEYAENQRTK